MIYQKVMVIDDSHVDRFLVEKVVQKADFADWVISFESAKGALQYFNENVSEPDNIPDLLFLDINMPEMNGFDFLEAFDRMPEMVKTKCKIVMLSSSLHSEDKEKALASPYVRHFINKPLTFQLLDTLRDIR